jgi:hypothetical protein
MKRGRQRQGFLGPWSSQTEDSTLNLTVPPYWAIINYSIVSILVYYRYTGSLSLSLACVYRFKVKVNSI